MKKIFILIISLISINAYSQVDTSMWQFNVNPEDGNINYSYLTNREEYLGVAAGELSIPFILTDADTSVWAFIVNPQEGIINYNLLINKVEYMGIDSGLIRVPFTLLPDLITSSGNNIFTGSNTFTGSVDLSDATVTPNNNLYGYAHKDSLNTFSLSQKFTKPDSSIITKGIKGLTGQDFLGLYSPGSGYQGIKIYNTSSASQIFFYTGNGGALYTMDNNGLWIGDGTTGFPYISNGTPTVSNVSFSFYGDKNTGLLRNSADNVSLVTGGTARVTCSNTDVSFNVPFNPKGYTTGERDALTPQAGWTIYNTSTNKLNFYNGSAWEVITSAP